MEPSSIPSTTTSTTSTTTTTIQQFTPKTYETKIDNKEFECIEIQRLEGGGVKFVQCKQKVTHYCINCPGYRCDTHKEKQCPRHHKSIDFDKRIKILNILKLTDEERESYNLELCLKFEEQLNIKIPTYIQEDEEKELDKLVALQKLEWDQIQIQLQLLKDKKDNNNNNNNDNNQQSNQDSNNKNSIGGSFSELIDEDKEFIASKHRMEIRKENVKRKYLKSKDESIQNPQSFLKYDKLQKLLYLDFTNNQNNIDNQNNQNNLPTIQWGEREKQWFGDIDNNMFGKNLFFVSFIGPTGSGKSTLIRSLIKDKEFDKPIPGYYFDSHSTSADLNSYSGCVEKGVDRKNFMIVDSEGGGGTDPFLLNFQLAKSTNSSSPSSSSTLVGKKVKTEKQIRKETIRHFYPKFLYSFSDILIVVTNHSWQERATIVNLLIHCAAPTESSTTTKPTTTPTEPTKPKPHLILIFNKTLFSNCNAEQKAFLLDPVKVTNEFFKDHQTKEAESKFSSCTAMMIPQANYDHDEFLNQLTKLEALIFDKMTTATPKLTSQVYQDMKSFVLLREREYR
ncbi:hypothetical protein DFA_08241 [Cavenderia fasciculata]|uniref:Uncharacterized protein n=1 Tax=Cavenderia fasciculata TaxID=261658 RepID=F4Q5J2_CACFS|nr:uncharacterized protein DFA_08241 [Cavenderia fasciculata]EGG17251.1 hypothetical protein DFA_08241 [Cavenderia fasciculata]|eukprot:XP_004355735.1 hypothetical protein DFA_08241 [Cavenderia fasciculata]